MDNLINRICGHCHGEFNINLEDNEDINEGDIKFCLLCGEELDKEVELELFKYGTHHLNDAVNRKKAMGLMIEFIDEHLK